MDAHNEGYAARFGIPPDKVRYAPLNPDWFATRVEAPWVKEVAPGVMLSASFLSLGGEDYTNVYDLCVLPESPVEVGLMSFSQPKKPTHIFRDNPDLVALANASFFFITDEMDEIARQGPKEGTLNWCMRDGIIFGLPSTDRPALFEIDGKLHGKDLKARGEIDIAGERVSWVGGQRIMHAPREEWSRLYDPEETVLFNSGCSSIGKKGRPGFAMRTLETETYFTPEHADAVSLAVSPDEGGTLKVVAVKEGGGMGLFDGHFILQVPKRLFETLGVTEGTAISPATLDGIELSKVTSALTVGPSVFDYVEHQEERDIDHDRSFGQPPPFSENKRYARTVVFKDGTGLHIRLYDAVSPSAHFSGISPKEIAEHLKDGIEWAFFCDGGQTALIGTRDETGVPVFDGNAHYASHKRASLEARMIGEPSPEGSFLLGRPRSLPSAIGIRYREQKGDSER